MSNYVSFNDYTLSTSKAVHVKREELPITEDDVRKREARRNIEERKMMRELYLDDDSIFTE